MSYSLKNEVQNIRKMFEDFIIESKNNDAKQQAMIDELREQNAIMAKSIISLENSLANRAVPPSIQSKYLYSQSFACFSYLILMTIYFAQIEANEYYIAKLLQHYLVLRL